MNLIFFGPPGSGKGTYASRVAAQLGIPHISTGDIFRAEIAAGTPLGKKVEERIKKGILIEDETTIAILKKRIEQKDCKKGFILDGFPRTLEQMKALDKITKIDLVIDFVLDEKLIIKKTLGRRVCEKCGNTYNVTTIKAGKINMPPLLPKKEGICDKCSGRLVQRPDDNEKTIKDRIGVYKNQSEPILKEYKKRKIVKDVAVIGAPDMMVPIVIEAIKS